MPRTATTMLAAVAALALGGCLGGEERSSRIEGDTVTVYTSLPDDGVSAPAAGAVAAGVELALADANGRAGDLTVELVELSSSEPEPEPWDPDLISANADKAAGDDSAIAYIGEMDYGGSAVSVPITNDAGLLQVSPDDGLTSLTRSPIGRPRAGPERYYPTGERSFVRLVPADQLLAEALLADLRATGAERMSVLYDGQIQARELGGALVALGRRDGPEPVRSEEYRGTVDEIPDIVRELARDRPDAVVYAGIAGPGTGRILAAIDRFLPGVPVYTTQGMLGRDPDTPIPAAPESVTAFSPIPPPERLSAEGQRLLERLERREGAEVARPEAVYGYEAMRLVLDAIDAGGPNRARVVEEALEIRERTSPLGRYRVRATGEVETATFAVYGLHDGGFEFERMVE